MNTLDIEHLRQWVGRQETASDLITPCLVDQFLSTITTARQKQGQAPFGIQWCMAPHAAPLDQLGHDGHPAKGDFLPPVPYEQRMWAGGEVTFHAPLLIGDLVTRRSTIMDIQAKTGKSGALCFVTVNHEYLVDDVVRINERHDIVYRDIASTAQRPTTRKVDLPKAEALAWTDPDPTLLFRYSAMTFNGHRIHYDHPYATKVEGYGGLVVHGPLQAILMATLAENTLGKPLKRFAYRGVTPLDNTARFVTGIARTNDGSINCWCGRDNTGVTMKGTAWV